jgi:hypothetical protein
MANIIKLIFYVCFILLCLTVLGIVNNLQSQDNCQCNTGWKPENLKLISQIGILIGIINLIIPLNRTLYKIPLISVVFSILCLGVIIMYIFTMVRYFRNLKKINKCKTTCKLNKKDEGFINIISNTTTFNIILIGVIITICMLYL